jgi:hypothetical protein
MTTKLLFVLLVASCTLEGPGKNQCEIQSDCLAGYQCDNGACVVTSCGVCGSQCGDVPDTCGGTLHCGACQTADQCTGTCTGGSPHLMFVTSAVYQGGKIGGLDGADTLCQQVATTAHFTGNFRAWLSDSTGSPLSRMTQGTGDYQLVDGTVIAHGWDDLVDGQIDHTVNLDETGAVHTGGFGCMGQISAWTGTDFDGTAYTEGTLGNSCGNWDDLHGYGMLGDTNQATTQWTLDCGIPCTYSSALYCVEQ